jgi:hypothetical protein
MRMPLAPDHAQLAAIVQLVEQVGRGAGGAAPVFVTVPCKVSIHLAWVY